MTPQSKSKLIKQLKIQSLDWKFPNQKPLMLVSVYITECRKKKKKKNNLNRNEVLLSRSGFAEILSEEKQK